MGWHELCAPCRARLAHFRTHRVSSRRCDHDDSAQPANDNVVTAGAPFTVQIYGTATPTSPIPLPAPCRLSTCLRPTRWMANSSSPQAARRMPSRTRSWICSGLKKDLAAASPDQQIRPLLTYGEALNFHDGYIATYTAGLEHQFAGMTFGAAYVGTAGIKLSTVEAPNGYPGASPGICSVHTLRCQRTSDGRLRPGVDHRSPLAFVLSLSAGQPAEDIPIARPRFPGQLYVQQVAGRCQFDGGRRVRKYREHRLADAAAGSAKLERGKEPLELSTSRTSSHSMSFMICRSMGSSSSRPLGHGSRRAGN